MGKSSNAHINIWVHIAFVCLKSAEYLGGGETDNARDALKDISSIFYKIMEECSKKNNNNLK